jgi:hypothetical protein
MGLLALMIMSACASTEGRGALPARPDFAGFIAAIQRSPDSAGTTLRVESHADKIVRRHVVSLTRDTVLVRRTAGSQQRIDASDLQEKNWVRLWFSPPGRGEYPTEVVAVQIEVVDRID